MSDENGHRGLERSGINLEEKLRPRSVEQNLIAVIFSDIIHQWSKGCQVSSPQW